MGPRAGPRARLIDALAELVARDGYPGVTVAQVIASAGVSRATFYECFKDRADCLLAAMHPVHRLLHEEVRVAVSGEPAERCAARLTRALTDFALGHPGPARLAFSESLTAGGRVFDAREQMIAELALLLEHAYADLPVATRVPDVSSRTLIGALSRMLGSRLTCGEPISGEFSRELATWLASYQLPIAERRWHALDPLPPARSSLVAASRLRPPADPAPGAPRASRPQAAQQQRFRIIFATAEVLSRRGYHAATVAEIARTAGLDTPAFYRHFAGKWEALKACGQLLFGHVMAISAGAFVAGDSWPERVWEAAAALLQALADNPTLAWTGLVESHAAGAPAAATLRELTNAFTIFLEEGSRYESTIQVPSELCMEALATSVLELAYQMIRRGESERLPGLTAQAVFIALAPFLGAAQTSRFLEQRISKDRRTPRARGVRPTRHAARRRAASALGGLA